MTNLLFTQPPLVQAIQQDTLHFNRNQTIRNAHPSLIQLLDLLLPASGGLSFLEAFLSQATVAMAPGETAIVRARNQRWLAQLLGMDYDRLNKYVLVLQHMQVLQVREESPGVALYLPLGEPRLAHPDALDALTSYRPKVASFARQVKQRWLTLLQTGDTCVTSYTSQFMPMTLPDTPHSTPNGLMVTLADVQQAILDLYGASGASIAVRVLDYIQQQATPPAKLSATKGDLPSQNGDSPLLKKKHIGDSATRNGDWSSLKGMLTGDSFPLNGDSPFVMATPIGDSFPLNGDSPSAWATPIGDLDDQKGDSSATESPENRRLVATHIGCSRATSARNMGDSSSEMFANPYNVNVTLKEIINTINVNVRKVASYLYQLFGEDSQLQGYYINLYKQHTNPQAWLGALLETLIAHERGTVHKPGKYFYKRCVALHQGLPAETEKLISQFGGYTYAQLQEHLRGSSSPAQATIQTPANSQPATPQDTASSQPAASQAGKKPLKPATPLYIPRDKQHPGMSEETVNKVRQRIRDHTIRYLLDIIPYRQQDGTFSLLLASVGKHQRWIYSPEEWEEAYTLMCQTDRFWSIFAEPTAI
ncbi:hypothetical protein [Ktedonobacter robiniae]|uniref:DnaA N-terminal domain-containing protein n=1 Tax=Ktedonobacter robiniae TaxID=2778365 RepID=A0ABQ3V3N7_9CHLR|nr:hypothetical protein [Ktedonobacter robiniae]GHO59781.1 hypothetical protein KSB_82560 [Ktedonobacter robiniae]